MMRLVSTRTCAVLIAGGAVAAAVLVVRPHLAWDDHRLPDHWRDRIRHAPDATAAAMVRALEPVSATAVATLVELAASPRAAVAQAAQDRLDDWMFSLERRSLAAAGANDAAAGKLARAVSGGLARNADRFGPAGARWARQLCRRLLDVVDAVPRGERVALILECKVVLAGGGAREWQDAFAATQPDAAVAGAGRRHPAPGTSTSDHMLRFALQSGPRVSDSESMSAAMAVAPSGPGERPSEPESDAVPAPLAEGMGEEPDDADELVAAESEMPTASGPGLSWRSRQGGHFARVLPQAAAKADTIDVPSPEATEALEDELLHAPLADLLSALVSDDPFTSASAAAVLRTRGMSEVDLQVARKLSGADAEARLALLDDAARRPGATTSAWLHHFAGDESAEVRLRALTLLGTSRDEVVLQQVHARALRDENPQVRALARRMELTEAEAR